jgi:hypothetical protein
LPILRIWVIDSCAGDLLCPPAQGVEIDSTFRPLQELLARYEASNVPLGRPTRKNTKKPGNAGFLTSRGDFPQIRRTLIIYIFVSFIAITYNFV